MEETTKSDKKAILKRVWDIAYYAIIGIIILVAVFYMFITFSTKGEVTTIFGRIMSTVQSGSMSGTFETGDIIFIEKIDSSTELKRDDIITFFYREPVSGERIIVTHRIKDIDGNNITTQGDVARDSGNIQNVEKILRSDVIGKYNGGRIPALGGAIDFLKSPVGFFILVLVPVFLFLFWQIYVFIKTLSEARALGKKKAINDEARILAEQMLREMKEAEAAEAQADKQDAKPAPDTEDTQE